MTPPEQGWVITLDGPAGSGKSTTARQVALALDFVYLDTGALYRAITVLALRQGVSTQDGAALQRLAAQSPLEMRRQGGQQRVFCDGADLTDLLRSIEVEREVSAVSASAGVRREMLGLQRAQRRRPGLVAEGRDLGSIVFPDAHLKIFLVAELDVRARRRALERESRGEATTVDQERTSLAERDRLDSSREVAPLVQPQGAHVVDTSSISIEEQTRKVLDLFRSICG